MGQRKTVSSARDWYRAGHFKNFDEAKGAFRLAHQQGLDGMGKSVAKWMGLSPNEFAAWMMRDELPPSPRRAEAPEGNQFYRAVEALGKGLRVRRPGWEQGQYLEIPALREGQRPGFPGERAHIRTPQGDLVPWFATRADYRATDWQIEMIIVCASSSP